MDEQTQEQIDATEAAKAVADQHGVDLAQVEGSGADGRVTKPDVIAHVEATSTESPSSAEPGAADPDAPTQAAPAPSPEDGSPLAAASVPPHDTAHTVVEGDTLLSIAGGDQAKAERLFGHNYGIQQPATPGRVLVDPYAPLQLGWVIYVPEGL